MEMIVCMDYQNNGERVISSLFYYPWTDEQRHSHIKFLEQQHDEVYISNFDPTSQPFINEIVTHGCRLS